MLKQAKAPKGINFPDNFVCNVSKTHKEKNCYCLSCLHIDKQEYCIGDPVQIHPNHPLVPEEYCGIYLTDKHKSRGSHRVQEEEEPPSRSMSYHQESLQFESDES